MSLSAEEIISVMTKAKELGFTQLEVEGLKIGAEKQAIAPKHEPVPDVKAEDIYKIPSPFDEMSEEEELYFATPYGLELEAKRLNQQKQIKEEENK